ncbi:hypothetical protein J5X84_43680 [Streptosporangiaceae bacterium NEAU-GS5]|nr:hypothetical protein [Streptosporangiaceae bacterium NEAU-GS5]
MIGYTNVSEIFEKIGQQAIMGYSVNIQVEIAAACAMAGQGAVGVVQTGAVGTEPMQKAWRPRAWPGSVLHCLPVPQAQDEGADGSDRGRAAAPFRRAGARMAPFHQIAVPAHDGIRPNGKPQPAQDVVGPRCQEGGEEGSILGRESHPGADAELPFKNRDLVTQGENLDILVPIAHRQQPQHRESVREGQIGQTEKHSRSSCRTPSLPRLKTRMVHSPQLGHDLGGWNCRQAQSASGRSRSQQQAARGGRG